MRGFLTVMLLAAACLPALGQAQATVNICDRTPQVRDEILAAISASDCATVTAAQLASVTALCLHNVSTGEPGCRGSAYTRAQITELKLGDFAGLTGLQELGLAYNQLRALPEGVFAGLTSLHVLGLDGNQLRALPDGVFAGLTSLKWLWLDENWLRTTVEVGKRYFGTALPDGVFDSLISLQNLYLHGNYLGSIYRNYAVFDAITTKFPNAIITLYGQKNIRELETQLALLNVDAGRLAAIER